MKMKKKKNRPNPMWCSKSSSNGKVYSNTILPQETGKTSNRQDNLNPKAIGKKRTTPPKVSRREESIKIRAEISKTEIKATIAKISKTKSWFFEKTNKIDRSLAKFIKKKRQTTQINKIANEKREVTTDNAEMQRIVRDYYVHLCTTMCQ